MVRRTHRVHRHHQGPERRCGRQKGWTSTAHPTCGCTASPPRSPSSPTCSTRQTSTTSGHSAAWRTASCARSSAGISTTRPTVPCSSSRPRVERLVLLPCNYDQLLPMGRFDFFLDEDDLSYKFCEFNTDGSGAMSRDFIIGQALMKSETFKRFSQRHEVRQFELFEIRGGRGVHAHLPHGQKRGRAPHRLHHRLQGKRRVQRLQPLHRGVRACRHTRALRGHARVRVRRQAPARRKRRHRHRRDLPSCRHERAFAAPRRVRRSHRRRRSREGLPDDRAFPHDRRALEDGLHRAVRREDPRVSHARGTCLHRRAPAAHLPAHEHAGRIYPRRGQGEQRFLDHQASRRLRRTRRVPRRRLRCGRMGAHRRRQPRQRPHRPGVLPAAPRGHRQHGAGRDLPVQGRVLGIDARTSDLYARKARRLLLPPGPGGRHRHRPRRPLRANSFEMRS